MEYRFVLPPTPSLKRWRHVTGRYGGKSVLRMLQYEFLETLPLAGKVLDVGGGQKAMYLPLLPRGLDIASVNIDPGIAPTHLVQPGQPLPFADDSFDTIISLNTLEHIYDAPAVLAEMHRVLRPGGQAHITVPFMFRVHGHPDDYFRGTPSWWRETCARTGFPALDLHPLVWGRASTGAVVPGLRGIFVGARTHLAMWRDILSVRLTMRGPRMSGPRAERICSIAPGWFMTATK